MEKILSRAEILCVGTELLIGDIVNTNAAYLSRRLATLGIGVYRQSVVGDNKQRLAEDLRAALSRADLVITSGGLGPTADDMTKEIAAEVFGRKMELHAPSLARIERYFAATGRVMTPNNRKQAMMPEGAIVFDNDYGTAPALALESDEGKVLVDNFDAASYAFLYDNTVMRNGSVMAYRIRSSCGAVRHCTMENLAKCAVCIVLDLWWGESGVVEDFAFEYNLVGRMGYARHRAVTLDDPSAEIKYAPITIMGLPTDAMDEGHLLLKDIRLIGKIKISESSF